MKKYPLKFEPIFQYRIWGGTKLKTDYDKEFQGDNIGESWEISAVPGNETKVSNGDYKGKTLNDLIADFGTELLGERIDQQYEGKFPLLIKFIDAKKPLSIQVHPSDDLARQLHGSFGKNEMWYIMPSFDDASIIVGFNTDVDEADYQKLIQEKRLPEVLNEIPVKEGDVFYIPTGRVHAIGSGVVLAEIQQSSDVTYRIYDYDRKDARTGQKRELHTELALKAIDFNRPDQYHTDYLKKPNQPNSLVQSSYFKTNFWSLNGRIDRSLDILDSFVIYMCVKGSATCHYQDKTYALSLGQCLLLPHGVKDITWEAKAADLIEIYL
ncbi:type I phosphomannose isomerase catalytic subunit [Nonlabens xiamenensis]|uniref:type I phosphomannose isomerase catalytic subunit n=1 Tax=Nonlabens xiamenensis TaxID=2341043 RepID=UPI000F604EF5|nr:type I phosphomannose isomerase catalytic subunit [Nonlabens xiamenensis]